MALNLHVGVAFALASWHEPSGSCAAVQQANYLPGHLGSKSCRKLSFSMCSGLAWLACTVGCKTLCAYAQTVSLCCCCCSLLSSVHRTGLHFCRGTSVGREEATVFCTAEQLTVILVVITPCGVMSPVAQLLLREAQSS